MIRFKDIEGLRELGHISQWGDNKKHISILTIDNKIYQHNHYYGYPFSHELTFIRNNYKILPYITPILVFYDHIEELETKTIILGAFNF